MKLHSSEAHDNYRKVSSSLVKTPRWDFSSVIADMLKFYAEQVKNGANGCDVTNFTTLKYKRTLGVSGKIEKIQCSL